METTQNIIMLGILLSILSFPIFIVRKNYRFIKTNFISIPIISMLIALGAISPHFFKDIKLWKMNVNIEGVTAAERTKNVKPELRAEAEELYWSLMGVGWPIPAIFWIILMLPYTSIIFGIKILFRWVKKFAMTATL